MKLRYETQIPFSPMIPILGTLLKEIDGRVDKIECYKKLSIWYWASVFSNAYSGAVDSHLTSDFKDMRDWFTDDARIPRTVERARRELGALSLKKSTSLRKRNVQGYLVIICTQWL
jgi:hypothetical protein